MSKRRTSWTEVENPEGPNYFYDDPDLGGTGQTQWDNPLADVSDEMVSLGLRSANSSVQLRQFMRARGGNLEEKRASRLKTAEKQASIRTQRITKLRKALYGEELAANFRYEKVDTGEGEVYYVSVATGETTWDLPSGAVVVNGDTNTDSEDVEEAEEFEEAETEEGKVYYVGRRSGSVWELPSNAVVVPSIN